MQTAKQRKVLDSFALLAYLKMEGGFAKVKSILGSRTSTILMNEINIGETYYILARERGLDKATYFTDVILPSLPITPVSNTFKEVLHAARIKAENSLSFADCFAVATAIGQEAVVITGDPEFKKVSHLVEIDWV
jgi:predicted nucleic acid-binding protein